MKHLLGVLLLLWSSFAIAGPMPVPEFKPGQFVHTVPANYDPPKLGRGGLAKMQAGLVPLHHPFYVIVTSNLTEKPGDAVNRVFGAWQSATGFNPSTSTIAIMSYQPPRSDNPEPTSFTVITGGRWKSELGLRGEALKPYTETFLNHIRGSVKDRLGGVLAAAKSLDEDIFDQTDPERVAKRRQEAEKQAAAERENQRLESEARAHEAAQAAEQARITQEARDVESQRVAAATMATLMWVIAVVLSAGVVLGLVTWIKRRRRRYTQLQKDYALIVKAIEQNLDLNDTRQVEFFTGDLDAMSRMAPNLRGNELAQYNRAIELITHMDVINKARRERLKLVCRDVSSIEQLARAIAELRIPFELKTDPESGIKSAFEDTQARTTIDPMTVAFSLNALFDEARQIWDELKEALTLQKKLAQDHITQTKLDELFALCDKYNIPRAWLDRHPLFPDDDTAYYAKMNELLRTQPLAFKNMLREIRLIEEDLEDTVRDLIEALTEVSQARIVHLDPLPVVLDPGDDPFLALAQAQQGELELRTLLTSTTNLKAVESVRDSIVQTYQRAAVLYRQAKTTIERVGEKLTEAGRAKALADNEFATVQTLVETARLVHRNLNADVFMTSAQAQLRRGHETLQKALKEEKERRSFAALRDAEEALELFVKAVTHLQEARTHLTTLHEQKDRYTCELAQMPEVFAKAQEQVRTLRGNVALLSTFVGPRVTEPAIYQDHLNTLAEQRRTWDDVVRAAKVVWDAEQKRVELFLTLKEAFHAARRSFEKAGDELVALKADARTHKLVWPALESTESSPIEMIERDLEALRRRQTEWSKTVVQAKHAHELELLRKKRLQEFKVISRNAWDFLSCCQSRLSNVSSMSNESIEFDPPHVNDDASLEVIDRAIEDVQRQKEAWNETAHRAEVRWEEEQFRIHEGHRVQAALLAAAAEQARQDAIEAERAADRRAAARHDEEDRQSRARDDSSYSVFSSGNSDRDDSATVSDPGGGDDSATTSDSDNNSDDSYTSSD